MHTMGRRCRKQQMHACHNKCGHRCLTTHARAPRFPHPPPHRGALSSLEYCWGVRPARGAKLAHTGGTRLGHTLRAPTRGTPSCHSLHAHAPGTHSGQPLGAHIPGTHSVHPLRAQTRGTHSRHTLVAHTHGTHSGHALGTPRECFPAAKPPVKARSSAKLCPSGAPCFGEARWRGHGGLRPAWAPYAPSAYPEWAPEAGVRSGRPEWACGCPEWVPGVGAQSAHPERAKYSQRRLCEETASTWPMM